MSQTDKQHTGKNKHTSNNRREVWSTQRRQRRRNLGQNFLVHERTAKRIVREAAVTERDVVVEIGTGSGVLTRALANTARAVVAVEHDPYWASRLERNFVDSENVKVVAEDALQAPLPDERFRVVANPPFHISTAILHRLLDDPAQPLEQAHLLLQTEVATKHARTTPTTLKTLTWSPWWRFEAGCEISANAFDPKPGVDARLLVAAKREPQLVPYEHRDLFRALVREAFDGGGNVVSQALRPFFTKRQIRRLAQDNGFSAGSFCSQLTVHQWAAVFEFMIQAVPSHLWPVNRTGATNRAGHKGRG